MKYVFQLMILLMALAVLFKAQAATTATLQLKGTIPQLLSIAATPEPIATALPLETSQSSTKIATVTEQSNSQAGYSVTITSQNLGKLVRSANSFLNYSLTYAGQSVNITTVAGQTFSNSFVNASPQQKDLRISYNGLSNAAAAGDYTDVLTFTITAN